MGATVAEEVQSAQYFFADTKRLDWRPLSAKGRSVPVNLTLANCTGAILVKVTKLVSVIA